MALQAPREGAGQEWIWLEVQEEPQWSWTAQEVGHSSVTALAVSGEQIVCSQLTLQGQVAAPREVVALVSPFRLRDWALEEDYHGLGHWEALHDLHVSELTVALVLSCRAQVVARRASEHFCQRGAECCLALELASAAQQFYHLRLRLRRCRLPAVVFDVQAASS